MRTLVVFLSIVALVGCKTDKKQPTTQTGSGSGSGSATAAGSGSGAAAGSGAAGAPVKKGLDIALPTGDGSPPNKTTKKLDKATFEKLAALEWPGFKKDVREQAKILDVRHTTPRPRLAVTVTATECFDCPPSMQLDAWKPKEASLRLLLAPELRDRPDTIWELGQTELNGAPMIFTYQFGHHFGQDEKGQPVGAFSNAFALYHNDGINQIRVVAEYKDDPSSREDMLAMAPREDLEKLARAFMDAYTHAW